MALLNSVKSLLTLAAQGLARINRQHDIAKLDPACSGFLTAGIFALDYAAGREFDLWLLYVLPVGLASVVIGPRYGFSFAAIATGLLFLVGYLLGNTYTSITAFLLDRASE